MLSISEELSNFKPINVVSLEQKIGKIPEDMKNAIDLYNKALEDIENNNEDMAIIALKKAIAIYPAFYEAMNLMGVCYISLKEEENARIIFNRVIQMDDNSIRASRYLDQIDGKIPSEEGSKSNKNKIRNRNKAKTASTLVTWAGSGLSPEQNHPYYFKYILGFIVGVLTICLIWLILPMDNPLVINLSKPINESEQLKEFKNENLSLTTRLNETIDALKTSRETEKQLQDQMDQYAKWSAILRDLQNLADDGKYKDVIVEIEKNLAGVNLPKDIEDEIIALNNTCKPKAIRQFYDSAKEIYSSNANAKSLEVYQESANEYLMAIRIMEELQEKPSYLVEVYYYGGKAIALSESPTKQEAQTEAVRCFNMVVSAAPGSKLASYAQARINEIESGKAIRH